MRCPGESGNDAGARSRLAQWGATDRSCPVLRQVARLQREERLGALSLELANKKTLRLSELRGFTRAVRASMQAQHARSS